MYNYGGGFWGRGARKSKPDKKVGTLPDPENHRFCAGLDLFGTPQAHTYCRFIAHHNPGDEVGLTYAGKRAQHRLLFRPQAGGCEGAPGAANTAQRRG